MRFSLRHTVLVAGIVVSAVCFAPRNAVASDFAIPGSPMGMLTPDASQFLFADYQAGELWIKDLRTAASQGPSSRLVATLRSGNQAAQSLRLFAPHWSQAGGTILFLSFDESQRGTQEGQIFSVKPDGSEFRGLSALTFGPDFRPLTGASPLSPYMDGWRVLFLQNLGVPEQTIMEQMEIDGRNRSSFAWHKGVVNFSWSPGGDRLVYLARPQSGEVGSLSLWLTRPDGGQLKRLSTDIYVMGVGAYPPAVWSADGEFVAFFSRHIDERMQAYLELEVVHAASGTASVVYRTWGTPRSSLTWDSRSRKIAFAEIDARDSNQQGLITIDLKRKDDQIRGVRDVKRIVLPMQSEWIGWDAEESKWGYLLEQVSEKGRSENRLWRIRYDKEKKREVVEPNLPTPLFYQNDREHHRLILCGRLEGCHLVPMPSGKSVVISPSFHSQLALSDFHLLGGRPAEALDVLREAAPMGQERDRTLQLEPRRVVAMKRNGQEKEAQKAWDSLLALIDRGENPSEDYLEMAHAMADIGETEVALDSLKKVLEVYPKSAAAKDALMESGLLYRKRNELDFAKNCFGNFARLYPKDRKANMALIELGETFLQQEEAGKAMKVFRKVLGVAKSGDERALAFIGQARSLEQMNRFQDAGVAYKSAADLSESDINPEILDRARQALARLSAQGR